MWLTIGLFIFMIGFVIAWAKTDKLTYQISAALFLVLIYSNANTLHLKEIQRYNETILQGIMLIIEQNELTQDIVDEKTKEQFATQPKYHSA